MNDNNNNDKPRFSHIDEQGKANMVDVGMKNAQEREALASGKIFLSAETIELVKENKMRKGEVLTIAEISGIQAAKQTSTLIPLCHPLLITKAEVRTVVENDGITVNSMVRCIGQTGVEMEALTAVSVALLTIYDMCKAVDKNMVISDIKLLSKAKKDILA